MKSTVASTSASCAAGRRSPRGRPSIRRAATIPGLRRDVLFTSTADEEAGGSRRRVDRRARGRVAAGAGALSEAVASPRTIAGSGSTRSRSPKKGYAPFRITVRGRGPRLDARDDNAAVLAAT
jgi:hypothetical protein